MKQKSCVALLRTCAVKKDVDTGKRLHAALVKEGSLRKSSSVLKALVRMYAHCGVVAEAHDLLHELPVRDAISWNALIVAYAHQGRAEDALCCFEQMQHEGLSANEVTFFCLLKSCGSMRAEDRGGQIFAKLMMQGLQGNDFVVGTALVHMYVKCGALAKAQQVLERLPRRDVVSWNTLIAGYAQQGQGQKALSCFEQMRREGLSPSPVTFTCILKACGSIGALDKGIQIHDKIVEEGVLVNDVALGSSLVDMYIKCGALEKAKQVLEDVPILNTVLWNALITRYIKQGQEDDALTCFKEMQLIGISPDIVTFICILKACGNIKAADKGKEIHHEIAKQGLLSDSVSLGNALVDMYVKCGALDKAHQVFEKLPVRDIISWSSLVAGYAQHGQNQDALNCFIQMQNEGLSPNAVTFISLLKVCGSMGAADMGEQVHDEVARLCLLEDSSVLGNALVDMYSKCGAFSKAHEVLEKFCAYDVISWNALIAGYVQQGQGQNALDCFQQMQYKAFSPDEVTFTCILKACGSLGAIDKGKQIHDEISRKGLLEENVVLGNALIDMYAKCGALAMSQQVLERLPARNVITWSTIIAGFAQHGRGQDALECFSHLLGEGFMPNVITFSSVLNACSHSGLVDEGQACYLDMQESHGITPVLEHHSCIVDLLVRAGHINKAVAMIEIMPFIDYPIVWAILLSACQRRGDINVGKWAFEHTVQVENGVVTPYNCMSYLCAAAGLHEDVKQIDTMRNTAWGRSECGRRVNVNKDIHSFMMETVHADNTCIYAS